MITISCCCLDSSICWKEGGRDIGHTYVRFNEWSDCQLMESWQVEFTELFNYVLSVYVNSTAPFSQAKCTYIPLWNINFDSI